ncbi:MAG: hypothetical protein M3139_01230 [Bacteroidota bacterium]|nr:hypothetical protein [Bacteroidota bacterium]
MNAQNAVNKKQLKFRFALLYITSLVLLSLIFLAFWNMYGTAKVNGNNDTSANFLEEHNILKQDESLHSGLIKLQQLDAKYARMFADSADKKSLDSLNLSITNAENAYSASIEKVANQEKQMSVPANKNMLDSIISSFKMALNNRRAVGFMRAALASNANLNDPQRRLLMLQMDVNNKNEKILSLQNEIKNERVQVANNTSAPSGNHPSQQQVQDLQASITKEKQDVADLISQNNTLLKDNNRLNSLVTELKANTTNGQKSNGETSSDMVNKIDDLNARLAFAQVDCNLTRADARQIISNSRQRKELLQEALTSLNALSQSKNPTIQQKAREKLTQLQSIASASHD